MPDMATKKKAAKVFPSRQRIKYVGIPKDFWDTLEAKGKEAERSVAFFVRKYVREGMIRDGILPNKS